MSRHTDDCNCYWCHRGFKDIAGRLEAANPSATKLLEELRGDAAYLRGWHDRGEADARIAISRPNAPSQCCDYTAADIYDAIRALPPTYPEGGRKP